MTPKDLRNFLLQYGGESSNTVRDRMMQTLTNIMEQMIIFNVLAVSHSESLL